MQRRNLHAERLEERMLLAVNPFHNGFWPEDVDNNLRVTAADVLPIVNGLNEGGSQELITPGAALPDMADVPYYLDVSGDGALTALDALKVVNTINGGEGETAPSDAVRYRLAVTDMDGNALTNNTVSVGQTFQLRGYVQDVRFQGGSTGNGNATGVFAGYADVLMTNKHLAEIRYGETQDLRMDVNHPGGVFPTGTITLGFKGQTTGAISYFASPAEDALAIQQALEALSTVGTGNVEVTTLQGTDFEGRFFVRFKRALGEQNVPQMTVQGTGLQGSYLSDQDLNDDGKLNDYVNFNPQPVAVDNYIPINPTTDDQRAALFRSSLTVVDPYTQGRSAVDEPLEAGQPAGSRNLGELGAFLNRNDLNSPPTYTTRKEYHFFTFEIRALSPGQVSFSGNVADIQKTLVFNIKNTGGDDTTVPPSMIGFYQDINNGTELTVTITAPITVVDDTPPAVLEDSGTTSIAVLGNDSVNPAAGGVAPLSLVAGGLGAVNPAGSATVAISGNNVNFKPADNFSGQVTFTYQAKDAASPAHTGTGTVTVDVTAVNDAPLITLSPLPDPINEDAGAVPVPPGTIVVQDVDAGTSLLQATIAVTGGTVTLNDKTGLTFTTGDGVADANMVFTGTLAALNNAANNATFNTAENFNGTAKVAITVNDQGNTGSGGPKSDTKTLSITVTPINDPPVNTVPPAQTVIELDTLTFAPVISTTDVEVLATGASVQVNLDVNNGKLNLGTQTGLTDVTGLGTDAVSFRGTLANVNAALATLTYQANAFPQNDTLTITTSDLGTSPLPVLTRTDLVPISVIPSSRPSAVADTADPVAEDSGAATVNVLANDIDVNSQVGPTNLTISAASDPANGTVTVAADGKSLTYQPDGNFFGDDTFTYTIVSTLEDQGDGPSTATVFVTVNGINDSPAITAAPTTLTTPEDIALALSGANGFVVADIDADASGGVQVTASVGHGTLNAPNGATTITGANTGSLTISGLVAAVNASLAGLTYTPAPDYTGGDALQFVVDDLGYTGGGAAPHTDARTVPITVTPVNDAPTITAPTTDVDTTENTPLVFLASGANKIAVDDVDNNSLTVGLTVTNGTLKLQTNAGLTFNSGADNTAAMNFTGTIANINAALNGMQYLPTTNYEGPATLGITANDGLLSDQQDVSLIVSGVNDPPVNNLPATTETNEDTALSFTGANLISITDVDAGASNILVNVTVTNGVFTLNPTANMTGVVVGGNGTGSVSMTGPLATINGGLNGSTYAPAADFNTPDTGIQPTLTITTDDKGRTGTGGAKADTDVMTITVNPVNDPPVANDDGSPTSRMTVLWNTTDNPFAVLGNDSIAPDKGETLIITKVDTTNAHGTVTVQNGKLLYTPTANYTGPAEIVYTVEDRADGSGLPDTATAYLVVVDFVPSDVSGYVFFDFNGDGVKDPGEWGIGGVQLTLSGTDIQGNAFALSTWTDGTGLYEFKNVMPCQVGTTYTLIQQQPTSLVDGMDTVGDQGQPEDVIANDRIRVFLPLFGYGEDSQGNAILGSGNNFAELGFRAEFAGLGLWDLLHSDPADAAGGAAALLFGTDVFGNLQWYMNLGGWNRYIPGRQSPTSPSAYAVTAQNGQLPVTDTAAARVREVNAADEAIRSAYSRAGGWVTRITGEAEDFGLPAYTSAAVVEGEGEGLSETSDAELLAANTGTYEAAVDAVLAEVA